MIPIWFKIFIPLSLMIWAYFFWFFFFKFNPYFGGGLIYLGAFLLIILFPVVLAIVTWLLYNGQSIYWAVLPVLFLPLAIYCFYEINFARTVERYFTNQSIASRQEALRFEYEEARKNAQFRTGEIDGSFFFITIVSTKAILYSVNKNADGITWEYREPVLLGYIEEGNVIRFLRNLADGIPSSALASFKDTQGKNFTSIYRIIE